MSDVERLLAEYVAEHRAGGEADPARVPVARVPGRARGARRADRRLPRAGAAAAVRRSALPRLECARAPSTSSSARSPGRPGYGPPLLPRLRDRAGLKRSALVERLAAALGVRTARRRSPATTTRWSRACCPPRVSRTGCSRRSGSSSARPRRRSETPDGRSHRRRGPAAPAGSVRPTRLRRSCGRPVSEPHQPPSRRRVGRGR